MTEPEVSYNTDKKYTAKSQSATTFFLGLSKEFNFTRLTVFVEFNGKSIKRILIKIWNKKINLQKLAIDNVKYFVIYKESFKENL